MSGGVPAGERREQIADIIADHVSGPVVQDWDIQQAHRQDQLTAADKIAALFPTPTPPIEGRDADVERVLSDAADYLRQYADFIRTEVKADDFERHPYVPAIEDTVVALQALQALGERG